MMTKIFWKDRNKFPFLDRQQQQRGTINIEDIADLKTRVNALKASNADLKTRVDALEALNDYSYNWDYSGKTIG